VVSSQRISRRKFYIGKRLKSDERPKSSPNNPLK